MNRYIALALVTRVITNLAFYSIVDTGQYVRPCNSNRHCSFDKLQHKIIAQFCPPDLVIIGVATGLANRVKARQ